MSLKRVVKFKKCLVFIESKALASKKPKIQFK